MGRDGISGSRVQVWRVGLGHACEARDAFEHRGVAVPMGGEPFLASRRGKVSERPRDDQRIVEVPKAGDEIREEIDRKGQLGDRQGSGDLGSVGHSAISPDIMQQPEAGLNEPSQLDHSAVRSPDADDSGEDHENDQARCARNPLEHHRPACRQSSPYDPPPEVPSSGQHTRLPAGKTRESRQDHRTSRPQRPTGIVTRARQGSRTPMTRQAPQPRSARDRGSVTLWSLAVCVAIGVLGLAVTDAWRAISAWRRTAAAADAAAVAGASGIDEEAFRTSHGHLIELDPRLAEALAAESLQDQQDRGEIVTGTNSASAGSITVEVTSEVDLPVLGIIPGQGPITMTATATADPRAPG